MECVTSKKSTCAGVAKKLKNVEGVLINEDGSGCQSPMVGCKKAAYGSKEYGTCRPFALPWDKSKKTCNACGLGIKRGIQLEFHNNLKFKNMGNHKAWQAAKPKYEKWLDM